jgi:predicted dinucleotide-binding enzyme
MKVAIIGAGNVGKALALGWAKAGESVFLGVRNPSDEDIVNFVKQHKNLSAVSVREAAQAAEAIVIAAVPEATKVIATQLGDVSGKVIIDAMNTVRVKPEPFASTFDALKSWTNCKAIVKCFNSTGFENMANPDYNGTAIDMFVAGSSEKGKAVAMQLAKASGFAECYDFGGDDKVPLLEQFAMAWINLAIIQKHGRNLAFKIIKR